MTKVSCSTIAFLSVVALACGDGAPDAEAPPGSEADASAERQAGEEPALPLDSVGFEAADGEATPDLSGTLWLSSSQPGDADGVSLIAQLEGVPDEQAYAWAIHQGACGEPDQVVLPLGYGTEAVDTDTDRSQGGGPLGETRAAFEPTLDGEVEETVWVPLDGQLSRARLEGTPHTLRIHPFAGGDDLDPSVACAPIPRVPESSGSQDGSPPGV